MSNRVVVAGDTSTKIAEGERQEDQSSRGESGVRRVADDEDALRERIRESREEVHHLVNVISAVRGLLQIAERLRADGDHEGAWKYVKRATERTAG